MSISTNTATLKLDAAIEERVQRFAAARQRSSLSVMSEAIEQYLTREEKREQFRQDTLDAWEEYETTGLHLTAEEADVWLAKLGAGENCAPPECHR